MRGDLKLEITFHHFTFKNYSYKVGGLKLLSSEITSVSVYVNNCFTKVCTTYLGSVIRRISLAMRPIKLTEWSTGGKRGMGIVGDW